MICDTLGWEGGLAKVSLNITWGRGGLAKCQVTICNGNFNNKAFVMSHKEGKGARKMTLGL